MRQEVRHAPGSVAHAVPRAEGLGLVAVLEALRERLPEVAALVLGFAVVYGVWCVVDYGVMRALGQVGLPLVVLTVVVDAVWPALLTATYHGLAADDADVKGRH